MLSSGTNTSLSESTSAVAGLGAPGLCTSEGPMLTLCLGEFTAGEVLVVVAIDLRVPADPAGSEEPTVGVRETIGCDAGAGDAAECGNDGAGGCEG